MESFFLRRLQTTSYKLPTNRRGLTVIELLVFSAIFTVVVVIFITVLVSVTRVQVRQDSTVEVASQSNLILATIERYVARSSVIEMPSDTATTTIKLRMASSTSDPTLIYASGTALYAQEGTNAPEVLNSSRVAVSDVSFAKRSNPGGHDSVSISFTVQFTTGNILQRFTQLFRGAVARVSAATFDSNLVPAQTNTYKLGVSSQDWQSINNTIFFSGSNVGIGVSTPAQALEVNGGVRLNTTGSRPNCDVTTRGTFWVIQSGAGTKDDVSVCVKKANDTYFWSGIY